MSITVAMEHLERYKDIARLLIKYGHSDVVADAGLEHILPSEEHPANLAPDPKAEELANELAADLETMGPVYIKLGQVLSSRGDLLPARYTRALGRLQDKIKPFPFPLVAQTVQQELGCRLSKAFQEFEEKPMAAGSLGQVHRAVLLDGRPVAVKVQRPGIGQQVAEEMEVLAEIACFVDTHTGAGRSYRFGEVLEEFRKNLIRELDYLQEARNLIRFGENLKEFTHIVVPQPVEDYTTSRVLTMDYIRGRKITAVGPLRRMELDGPALADDLFRAYLQQTLVDGVFHADPHPGNVFITDDSRLALLDLGMVGHLSDSLQDWLLKLLIALSEGRGEEVADLAIKVGETLPGFDETRFRHCISDLVEQQQDIAVKDLNIGRVMLDFARLSGDSAIRMPRELTMLSKSLLNLDEIGRILAPEFNPNAAIRQHAAQIMQRRMLKSLSLGNLVGSALEAQEFAREMPGRVNRILEMLSKNQMTLHVEAFDEGTLIEGFQKVANRITTGLVLAALIIGASMLMRIPSGFEILGYPGLAMVCFLGAAGGSFWLLLTILMSDRAVKHKSK